MAARWASGEALTRPSLGAGLALSGYIYMMLDRTVTIHRDHAAAAAADRETLRSMTPQARLDQLLRLQQAWRARFGDAGQGLARVARVVDRPPR